ncbi:MAG: hypothetical protein M1482_14880 [Chloroflexi bacterium]|nr:hypothetical protein [Chloroflexota bacterium]
MNIENFYSLVAGTCFALVGLWWNVVNGHPDWMKDEQSRHLAGGIYASFLIPGLMSLAAQIGGDNKLIWRGVFVSAALLGAFFVTRLVLRTRAQAGQGLFRRSQWVVVLLYGIVLVFALFPQLAEPMSLQPLQVEGILLALLILVAHGLTWEFMTVPREN